MGCRLFHVRAGFATPSGNGDEPKKSFVERIFPIARFNATVLSRICRNRIRFKREI